MPAAPSSAATLTPGELVAQRTIAAYTLTPAQLQKSEALHRTGLALSLASTIFGLGILVALIAARFGPKVQRVVESISKRRFTQAVIFVPALLLTLAFFEFPLEVYGQHIWRAYGLSVQGWSSWLADWAKAELLAVLFSYPRRMGPVRNHSPGAQTLVALRLARRPARHGRLGLCRARPHRSALQPL